MSDEKFCLSNERIDILFDKEGREIKLRDSFYYTKSVREFIKRLKEELCYDKDAESFIHSCTTQTKGDRDTQCMNCQIIDELAGEKLSS